MSNTWTGNSQVILVIEGGDFNRRRTRSLLGESGHDIVVIPTGREALLSLGDVQPDCIVVGLELSDLQGLAAVDALVGRSPGTPVIAVAANPTVQGAVDAIRHGAVDVLGWSDGRERWQAVVKRAFRPIGI